MAVIDELKEMRDKENELYHGYMRDAFTYQSHADVAAQRTRDLDRAIAALEPPPAAVTEPEIPEGFTKWNGGGFTEALHCKDVEVMFRDGRVLQGVSGEFTWSTAAELLANGWKHEDAEGGKIDAADDIIAYRIIEAATADEQDDDTPAEHISILTGDPAIEPESGLHDSAGPFEPKPWSLITAFRDGFEGRKQIAPDHHVYMEEYNKGARAAGFEAPASEPEPTKPEADALAKAADYYSPEAVAERNKFNPFAMFRKEDGQ